MSDAPSGSGEFRVVLRGYEREQVDAFIGEAVERIDALERERVALMARLGEGGVDDRDAEIDAVTSELNRILHAAHEAAEVMRTRASQEAATWRAEAEAETRAQRQEAEQQAEEMRSDAWATAESLLEQVTAYSVRLRAEAEKEALSIRAAAEREASRYVGQARQDGTETVRSARLEADRMMEDARRESHNLVEAAKLEAEAAQQRARALEERRAELMSELDVAQEAIAKLESDLTARKEALRTAGTFETSTVRVVTEPKPHDEEWFDEDETVRVVSLDDALAEPMPVDALEFADEVRELRQRRQQAESAVAELLSKATPTPVAAAPPPVVEPEPVAAVEAQPAAQPVAETEPQLVLEPEPEPEPEPVAAAAPEPAVPSSVPADVDSLFAALRSSTGAAPANGSGGVAAAAAATATAPGVVAVKDAAADPFELRDRLLLPVTNRTLRDSKKALVELQNQTLEELREVGEGWRPERNAFHHAFRNELETLGQEALEAGFAAAAELAGSSTVPQPHNVAPSDPTNEVAGALFAEVDEVARRAAASGAGHRQVTAAVSRVFRTWRTDAAERHLRAASLASYHDGVLWGLETLGVESVKGVADGARMCAECPASVRTAWAPTDSTPKGTGIPPVHLDCACTIVPGWLPR